jgi:hypothetical protein
MLIEKKQTKKLKQHNTLPSHSLRSKAIHRTSKTTVATDFSGDVFLRNFLIGGD